MKLYDGAAESAGTVGGRVVRLAAKSYHPERSKPKSDGYTTRKLEVPRGAALMVDSNGAAGDYNHYRSTVLQNTTDRALSVLTTDSIEMLRSNNYPVLAGDLGENVLVDGVDFTFFQPGKSYRFQRRKTTGSSDDVDDEEDVEIMITEPMMPCANLCRLPYVNDPSKSPRERVATCRDLLDVLDQGTPGLRGWYARVTKEGSLEQDAVVTRV